MDETTFVRLWNTLGDSSHVKNFFDAVHEYNQGKIELYQLFQQASEHCGTQFTEALKLFFHQKTRVSEEYLEAPPSTSTLGHAIERSRNGARNSLLCLEEVASSSTAPSDSKDWAAGLIQAATWESLSEAKFGAASAEESTPRRSVRERRLVRNSKEDERPVSLVQERKTIRKTTRGDSRSTTKKKEVKEEYEEVVTTTISSSRKRTCYVSSDGDECDEDETFSCSEEEDWDPYEEEKPVKCGGRKFAGSFGEEVKPRRKARKRGCGERASHSRWTEEENQKLLKIMLKKFPNSEPNNWAAIANLMRHKTASQCFQHWKRVLNPNIKKGAFSVEEEEKLWELTRAFGNDRIQWSVVADGIAKRTDTQCRYHYFQRLHSQQIAWEKYEDSLLNSLLEEFSQTKGNEKWLVVGDELWKRLQRNAQTLHKTPLRSAFECKKRAAELTRT